MSADTRRELVYAIETADRRWLLYQAEDLEGILNAAASAREDFPGEEIIVTKGGQYDPQATLLIQDGLAV
jgi:hypothetical protein